MTNTVNFANDGIPTLDPFRQGDVIGLRFEPKEGTPLAKWVEESRKSLMEIVNNTPADALYARMRELRGKDTIDYAYGEKSGHVHTTLPGEAALGLKVGLQSDGLTPSKGINVGRMPKDVIEQLVVLPTTKGVKVPFNFENVTECYIVTSVKPFGVYHLKSRGLSTSTFDVESLRQEDVADHQPIVLDEGNWLFIIQASVNLMDQITRVTD